MDALKEPEERLEEALLFYSRAYTSGCSWMLPLKESCTLRAQKDSRQQVCRFCNRAEPMVSFRKQAHAISGLIGNKTLFVDYECDKCNQMFGDTIENHFGNWSKPFRTIAQIKGRKGVPTIKSRDFRTEFNVEGGTLHVSRDEDRHSFYVDDEKKLIKMILPRDTYRPLFVLKALVKYAINLIPEEKIDLFMETVTWVSDVHGTSGMFENQYVAFQYQQGPSVSNNIHCGLFFRANDYLFLPYCFMLLTFGNVTIQVTIPCLRKDWHIIGRKKMMPLFPTYSMTWVQEYGLPDVIVDEMTSCDPVKSDLHVTLKQA